MVRAGRIKCIELVDKSENQNKNKDHCKCKKEAHKVWCAWQNEQIPDEQIADRKFDPAQIQANCTNGIAYCAKGARYRCHSLVHNSKPRSEEPGECKCSTYFHKVFCPGTKAKIQDRKFDPEETKEKCPNGNAYCAKNNLDAKAPKWEMVVDQGISSQINTLENNQAEVDGTVQEMHLERKQEKELRPDINPVLIKDTENNLVVIKDPVATQPRVIKAHDPDVSESREQKASATSSKSKSSTAGSTTTRAKEDQPSTTKTKEAQTTTASAKKAEPTATKAEEAQPTTTSAKETQPSATKAEEAQPTTTSAKKALPSATKANEAQLSTKQTTEVEPATKKMTLAQPSTQKTTEAAPTTTSTTEEDPSQVLVYLAPKFWASTEWKCCENSKYRDDLDPEKKEKLRPKIQYIKDPSKVPAVRSGCGTIARTATGCGCMFGDSWHNIDHQKVQGTCMVTLKYAMEATGWPKEDFAHLRTKKAA